MSHAFRQAVESRDLDGLAASLHPDVVFRSPAVFKPYEGRDTVMVLLGHVIDVLGEFRYTDELTGVGTTALVFQARTGDRDVQGIDVLRVDDAGLVTELIVMIRPLSSLIAVAEEMGKRLSGEASGPSR